MDQFDQMLKTRARTEEVPMPEGFEQRLRETCQGLKDQPGRFIRSKCGGVLAAGLALFISVPNLSPAAAAAMVEVPMLGPLVELVTIREYVREDENTAIYIQNAVLSGGNAANTVSLEAQYYTQHLLEEFESECEENGVSYFSLNVTASVVTDTEDWFTLRLDGERVRASGEQFVKFYHIDKTTDQTVTLSQLYEGDESYIKRLSEQAARAIGARGEQVDSESFGTIDADQNFYFNKEGRLVLVFDECTIAPSYMGVQEIVVEG